jgi:hypothetical protein
VSDGVPNDWKPKVDLQHYIERVFEERDVLYREMFAAKAQLSEVERRATEKALELASRASDARFRPLEVDMKILKDAHAGEAGRKVGMNAIIGYIVGAVGLVSLLLKAFGVY